MPRGVGLEDKDAVAAETKRAVLIVFAIYCVLAGSVLPEIHAVDAEIADGEVLVHVEKRAVDRRHGPMFAGHLGGLRAARLMREPQRIVRRVRDFQHENLLVRSKQLLPLEPALPQEHPVEGVGLPVAVHKRQGVALGVEAEGESDEG